MNFLSHALIAGNLGADKVGGLIGDFIKGPLPAGLPGDIADGVALHRAIDSFADQHPAFRASRARVSASRRRVAGILVDLFYDHLLARDWAEHGQGSLDDYVDALYGLLDASMAHFPDRARAAIVLMQAQNWLSAYRRLDAIANAIDLMSAHRFRHANPLAGGIEEFLADPAGFRADFRSFLPDAIAFSTQWRSARNP